MQFSLKPYVFFSLCLMLVSTTLSAQNTKTTDAQPLKFKIGAFSNSWEENGVQVSSSYVKERFKSESPLAYDVYKQGRQLNFLSVSLAVATGFNLGVTIALSDNLSQRTKRTNYIACGIGFITGVWTAASANQKFDKATDIYNDALNKKKTSLKFSATENGIGLALRF